MPLTRDELEQITGTTRQVIADARAADQTRITELEGQLANERSAREAAERRPPIYGDGQGSGTIRSVPESKEQRRHHVIQRVGNLGRALALARRQGEGIRAAAEIAEKRYGDKATGDVLLRSLSEGVAGDGGSLVEPAYAADLIELLYPQAVLRNIGARVVPMPTGSLTIHRLASGVTGKYEGELQNIDVEQQTLDSVKMSAKKLAVIVPASNELLHDTSGRVNEIVVADIGSGLSLREDLAGLRGDGTNDTPKGFRNQILPANVKVATTLPGALGMGRSTLRSANLPMRSVGMVMNSDLEALYYNYLSKNGDYVYREEMDQGRLLGMPYRISNQIPSNLTSDGMTQGTELYVADWSEFLIGETLALQLDTSTEGAYWNGTTLVSAFSTDQTLFRALTRHDFGLRHQRAGAVILIDLATVAQNA